MVPALLARKCTKYTMCNAAKIFFYLIHTYMFSLGYIYFFFFCGTHTLAPAFVIKVCSGARNKVSSGARNKVSSTLVMMLAQALVIKLSQALVIKLAQALVIKLAQVLVIKLAPR